MILNNNNKVYDSIAQWRLFLRVNWSMTLLKYSNQNHIILIQIFFV
jgi:hypothetical protein